MGYQTDENSFNILQPALIYLTGHVNEEFRLKKVLLIPTIHWPELKIHSRVYKYDFVAFTSTMQIFY